MIPPKYYKSLKEYISKRKQLLHWIRIIRAFCYLGPWRHLAVRILNNNHKNGQMPVNEINFLSSDLDADKMVHNIGSTRIHVGEFPQVWAVWSVGG